MIVLPLSDVSADGLFPALGRVNCPQTARREKTHSDDLGQIEALPSARRQFRLGTTAGALEGGRGRGRPETRFITAAETRELLSTQRSARLMNTSLSTAAPG